MLKKLFIGAVISAFGFSCSSLVPGGSISTDKKVYKKNETINVDYTVFGAEVGDCVALVNKDDPDTTIYPNWKKMADGNNSGKISFTPGYQSWKKPAVARYIKGCDPTQENVTAESDPFTYGQQ